MNDQVKVINQKKNILPIFPLVGQVDIMANNNNDAKSI